MVLLRLAGKRDLAQLNSFDLVVLLLLSNVVQNAVLGSDNSLWGGLVGAITLVTVNAAVVRLIARSDTVVDVLEGTETEIVRDGMVDGDRLKRLGLRSEEVRTAVLRQGANSMHDVQLAVLKPGGTIEVTLGADGQNATRGDVARLHARLDEVLARLGPA